MFEKLKELKKLKELQDSVKRERASAERNGIKVVMNGNFEVEEIKLNSGLNTEEQERILKEVLKEAKENIQRIITKNLMDSGIAG